MYDLSKMPERFADWPREARVEHLGFRFLKTPYTKEIDETLEHLFWTAGLSPEGEGCFIVGDTGIGKTTSVRMFTDRKYEELRAADPNGKWLRPQVFGTDLSPIVHKTPNGVHRPIAVVWVDPRPRFNSFLADTALGLQVNLGSRFTFGEACIEVAGAVEKQQVKMIIFDDVQHIIEANMDAYGAADVLKLLAKARLQVVCIGLEKALQLGDKNEQLERLVASTKMLLPLRCSIGDFPRIDENGKAVGPERQKLTPFRKFMKALDHRDGKHSVLPFDEPSYLSDPDMALRIHQAGQGYTGKIMKLVLRAAKLAIADGSRYITRKQHFAVAYRDASRCSDEANWFLLSFPELCDRFGSAPASKPAEDDGERTFQHSPKPSKSHKGRQARGKKSTMPDEDRRAVEDAIAGRR